MKFSAPLLSLALALSATATPTPIQRDLASIQSAISNIATAVNALDAAEKAYTGGDITTLQNDFDAVVAATSAGAAVANASGDLSNLDAVRLISPIQNLTTDIKNAISAIIAIKPAVVAAGSQTQILNDLTLQNTSATALAKAINSKVPVSLQNTAASLAAGITNAIQQGVDAYSN